MPRNNKKYNANFMSKLKSAGAQAKSGMAAKTAQAKAGMAKAKGGMAAKAAQAKSGMAAKAAQAKSGMAKAKGGMAAKAAQAKSGMAAKKAQARDKFTTMKHKSDVKGAELKSDVKCAMGGTKGKILMIIISLLCLSILFGVLPKKFKLYEKVFSDDPKILEKVDKLNNLAVAISTLCIVLISIFAIMCLVTDPILRKLMSVKILNVIVILVMSVTLICAIVGYFMTDKINKYCQEKYPGKKCWLKNLWGIMAFAVLAMLGSGYMRLFMNCSTSWASVWTLPVYIIIVVLFFMFGDKVPDF